MAVRGIHTDKKPWGSTSYTVHGFWVNDPNPSGIGVNSYKSAAVWESDYFLQLATDDECNTYWVSILEPPEEYGEARIAEPVERFEEPIEPVTEEEWVDVSDISISGFRAKRLATDEVSVIKEELEEEDALKVVQAAIDGVTEELIPYDPRFAAVFARTVPGEPLLVKSDGGNYYLVPFNLPIKVEKARAQDKRPVELDPIPIVDPIPIDPIEPIELNENNTLVVVRINGEDGSFKETSWVEDTVKYLPVSMEEALKLVSKEVGNVDEAVIKLVNVDSSPYYPAWQITIDGVVYIVSQDGTVSYDNPVKPIFVFIM